MIIRKTIKIILTLIVLLPLSVAAQVGGQGIPSTYEVLGENIQNGDIVSFNNSLNTYELASITGDENMFGVINITPIVVFRNAGTEQLPVVQIGEADVNVTTLNGPIKSGDRITTSPITGKGQRYDGTNGYILGYAISSFDDNNANQNIVFDGSEVALGTVKVILAIGPANNLDDSDSSIAPSTIFIRDSGETETGLETIFRYVTAALFAFVTLFVVLKTFGPNIEKGVVSVGRNPLAKTSIQAMVVFNVILILAISIVSFMVSLLIIFLPI